MSPSKLGVFAQLALAASAVLVPSSMSMEDMEALAINPLNFAVTLDCPGCPLASPQGDSYKLTPDVGSALRLDLEVADETNLNVGGIQLYPPALSRDTVHVTQIDAEEELRLRATGFQFRYNGAETVSDAGNELLFLSLRITDIEDVPVRLPELTIYLLKDTEGHLMIASAHPTPPGEERLPTDEAETCNEWPLLCQWKKMVADRINRLRKAGKGCQNRPHGHGYNPMTEEALEGKPPHRFHSGQPHHGPHHRPHGTGYHHGRNGRAQEFLRRAFFTILIPIVIGIFAGTVTYLIGMALGCLMAIAIAKIRGQDYQRIALEEDGEEAEESEKAKYAELPAYEAPPVYDEVSEKEVGDTK